MKVEASVLLKFQASSLADAGAVLDDLLGRAQEREDVEVAHVTVTTPPGAVSVSLPAAPRPGAYPPGVPRPPRIDGA
jgi:hypothetical protein